MGGTQQSVVLSAPSELLTSQVTFLTLDFVTISDCTVILYALPSKCFEFSCVNAIFWQRSSHVDESL